MNIDKFEFCFDIINNYIFIYAIADNGIKYPFVGIDERKINVTDVIKILNKSVSCTFQNSPRYGKNDKLEAANFDLRIRINNGFDEIFCLMISYNFVINVSIVNTSIDKLDNK
jgi:hypothetical protein